MKKTPFLFLTLMFFACTPATESQLCGEWIEIMPVHDWYIQGLNLRKGGRAESIGMQTLVYDSWSTRSGQLILRGRSIGNSQTIPFSDTLDIVTLTKDTLILGKGDQYRISYLRQKGTGGTQQVKSVEDGHAAELLFSNDSSTVQLRLSPQQIYRLSRRIRTDGMPVWNIEDDDTYQVEYRGEWIVSRRGKTLFTTSGSISGTPDPSSQPPARTAYEGFQWHRIEGAGLRFWAQNSAKIRLMADPELPGVVIVRNGDNAPRRVMQLFKLENNTIDDVISQLQGQTGWNDKEPGRFQEIESDRPNVKRYVLIPTGEYGQSIQAQMQHEPVSSTCNGWGIGNSGMRYFEIHDTHPDIALFLEIGQEAPLFDEQSIEITNKPDDGHLSTDILYTQTGTLEIGHEVRSFTPDGGSEAYWIIDKTGSLTERYDRLTGGIKNGDPVHATLKLEYNGKWDEGFAADYAGTFFVREIIELRAEE